jgi:anaerobic ribonucleoside-triphosphate reductase
MVENNLNGNGKNKKIPLAVKKRDGRLEAFNVGNIAKAIFKAAKSIGGHNYDEALKVAYVSADILSERGLSVPTVDDITSANEEALRRTGHEKTLASYKTYAQQREQVRQRKKGRVMGSDLQGNATDSFLMVSSASDEMSRVWERDRIVESLIKEAGVQYEQAKDISKVVENMLVLSEFPSVTTGLIRELAHIELLRMGLRTESERYKNYIVPRTDLETIVHTKGKENSNIASNNPEAINYAIAGKILKEYSLSQGVFSQEVALAHIMGAMHIHNLEAPTRVYCSSHSLEYIKKYGLKLESLQTSSSPAKHTNTLIGHLNTYVQIMQAYYAGALGIGYLNVFLAPYLEADLENEGKKIISGKEQQLKQLKAKTKNNDDLEAILEEEKALEELKKNPIKALTDEEIDKFVEGEAQYCIFSGSQTAAARGGQNIFLDYNIHSQVPVYLDDTLTLGPGGKYRMLKNGRKVFLKEKKLSEKMSNGYNLTELIDPETGRVVMHEKIKVKDGIEELVQERLLEEGEVLDDYGRYKWIVPRIAKAFLTVWRRGDERGMPFPFPKCDFHSNEDTFTDPAQKPVLNYACQVASENGSPYFIFDRDEVTLSACCRLRTALNDNYVLKHPESMRFCGFLNVTINLPQAAYRAARNNKGNLEGFLEEIDKTMDCAVNAHLQKRDFIKTLQRVGEAQWQTGKPSMDGQQYVDLDKATYIIGMIGLDEAVKYMTGRHLHELSAEEFESYALKPLAHMNIKAKEYSKQHGLKFSLEESPAESAARRFAIIDRERFSESKELIRGGTEPYYTNSVHFTSDAPIDLVTRLTGQSLFHPVIESGAIVHAFVGEHKPNPESIMTLVKKSFYNTQCAQLTISPEFSVCTFCNTTHAGLKDACPNCGHSIATVCNNCGHTVYENVDVCPDCSDSASGVLHYKTINGITRIVGYYSFVNLWNPSKLSELDDRHKGNYSLSSNVSNNFSIPILRNNNGHVEAIEIGKEGCHICDDTYGSLERINKKMEKDYGTGLNIRMYKTDNEEGLVKLMVAGVNPSRLPAVVFVGHNNEVLGKFETRYEGGKADMVTAGKVWPIIEEYMTRRK